MALALAACARAAPSGAPAQAGAPAADRPTAPGTVSPRIHDVADLLGGDGRGRTQEQAGWSLSSDPMPAMDIADVAAAIRATVAPDSWVHGRAVEAHGSALLVMADDAVHRQIDETLAELRSRRLRRIHVLYEVLTLDEATARELIPAPQPQDQPSPLRVLGLQPERTAIIRRRAADGAPRTVLTVGNGQRATASLDLPGWWQGLRIASQPVVSADGRYVTVVMEWSGAPIGAELRRVTVTLPDGGTFLVHTGDPGKAVLVTSDAIEVAMVDPALSPTPAPGR